MYGGRVYLEAIGLAGRPFGENIVAHQVQRVACEVERHVVPQRIHFLFQVESGGVDAHYGFGERQGQVVVDINARRGIHVYRQELHGFFLFRFALFLFLLPLLAFLLLLLFRLLALLLLLFVGQLGKHVQRVGARHQLFQAVGIEVGDAHPQCVLPVEQRILYPIVDGVVPSRGLLYDKRIFLLKVQSFQQRKRVGRRGEVERELFGRQAFGFQEALREVRLLEEAQQDVVGQVVGVLPLHDGVYGQRVYPGGVLAHPSFHRGDDQRIVEGEQFRGLRIGEVLVGVLQGIDAVGAGRHATDGEPAPAVRASHPLEGELGKRRIGKVGMQSHQYAFHRLQVGGIQHGARHSHRVETVACGEGVEEVLQRVALVIVLDGVAEVEGIGGVCLQGVLQGDDHLLAVCLDFGLLHLWGRDDQFLVRLVELDVFVEFDGNLLLGDVEGAGLRIACEEAWGRLVVGTSLDAPHAGTRVKHYGYHRCSQQSAEKRLLFCRMYRRF